MVERKEYLEKLKGGSSKSLKDVTAGFHYHTVIAESEEILDQIQNELQKRGFLAELRDYEPIDFWKESAGGMETAKEIRKHNKNMILVFVTVIEDYVFQAFDVGAFHYLIKPFTDEKFAEVLQAAAEQYLTVSKNAPRKQEEKYLMINAGGTHFRVCLTQIVYAEVYGRKVMLHTANEDIEYYGRLSELEKEAGENFFRTHRAFLVNFKYIVKYNASEIQLEKGTALIAKKNYPQFVKAYLRYNQRRERD